MNVIDLNDLEDNSLLHADLCIVGSGPAGLSIAREFAGTATSVLIMESGGQEPEAATQALYEIESEPPRQMNQEILRRRILGGSSHIWTGRCAPFQPLDFEKRCWVPNSGWPVTREDFDPWLDRAGEILGLGPNCYEDAKLWKAFGCSEPRESLNRQLLEPMFWQFSKSPRNFKTSVDFGKDRTDSCAAANVRLLLHANLTQIRTNEAGTSFDSAEIRTLHGKRARVRAKALILCCGGIENARLLLASNQVAAAGIGNQYDMVGRCLMDHTDCVVGHFNPAKASAVRSRFGHYWLDRGQSRHVYLHGLALSSRMQHEEGLVNCHAYLDAFDVDRRDPWSALERAKMIWQSRKSVQDLWPDAGIVLSQMGELFRGMYRRRVKHRPQLQKLSRIELHCILEQIPDPESRVTLSEHRTDALGIPLSKIDWKISRMESRTASRMAELICIEFDRLGLQRPEIDPWVHEPGAFSSHCVEKAHPSGTTRISDNPKQGVVDRNCQVHGVSGLFVSGSSVFPTSGAANPTLMIVASALRLADWMKTRGLPAFN